MKEMVEAIDTVRGAVMILYPMGLPEWDMVRANLENTEELDGTQAGSDLLDPDNSTMWWANKELQREKKLLDYCGKNEKTKIVAKIQRKGLSQPQREPIVSADEQKEMMAHWHRKQEESKKLAEQNDDDYMNSAWANPKNLKNSLVGGGRDISWRPGS